MSEWPVAQSYLLWQSRAMSPVEQREFHARLRIYASKVCGRVARDLPWQAYDEIVLDAVKKHADSFSFDRIPTEAMGRFRFIAMAHIKRIVRNETADWRERDRRQRPGHAQNLSTDPIDMLDDEGQDAVKEGNEGAVQDPTLQSNITTQEEMLLDRILKEWDSLPAYPWKRTFREFYDWCKREQGKSIGDFIEYATNILQLNCGKSTIRRHIQDGAKQLARWIAGEEAIPFG